MGRETKNWTDPPGAGHRRPGTAVLAKGRQRCAEILDAATELLVAEGYAGLSSRKIAARAGIRLANLQYYYPTKQDVVRALLERFLEDSLREIEERASAAAAATPRDRLAAALDAVLAQQEDGDACRLFLEIWALAARDPEVGRATREFYRRYEDFVARQLLAVAASLGRPRAAACARLVVAMLEGMSVLRLGGASRPAGRKGTSRELRGAVLRLAGIEETDR